MPTRSDEGDWIDLGHVSGVFGVKGEVRLFLHNPSSHLLEQPTPVVLLGPGGRRRGIVLTTRPGAGKRILGQIEGVASREEASALKDWRIVIPRSALPALEEGEYYVWQLQGAEVRVDGERIGLVQQIHTAGPVELLEIGLDTGGEPVFVPSLSEYIVHLDPEAGVVELSPGALEVR
ncbi:MAG TPA: 16S rRNA processing protein RimM [Deltaproteobacteria bacterium]|nr:16S rRNA processing protein RimM [Deltaproteobacteria bacterium]